MQRTDSWILHKSSIYGPTVCMMSQGELVSTDMHKYHIKIQYGQIWRNCVGLKRGIHVCREGGDSVGAGASRKSGHHCRTRWRGRTPRRCHSRASRPLGCRDTPCGGQSRGSGPESGSLRCRGGQSSRRCHRRDAAWPSSPAWRRQQGWKNAFVSSGLRFPRLNNNIYSFLSHSSFFWLESSVVSHPSVSSLPLNSARASFFSFIFSSSFFRCRSTMTLFRKLIWTRRAGRG